MRNALIDLFDSPLFVCGIVEPDEEEQERGVADES